MKIKNKIKNLRYEELLFEILNFFKNFKKNIEKKVCLELIFSILVAFFMSLIIFIVCNKVFSKTVNSVYVRYNISSIGNTMDRLINILDEEKNKDEYVEKVDIELGKNKVFSKIKDELGIICKGEVYITDINGNVVERGGNGTKDKFNIFNTMKIADYSNSDMMVYEGSEANVLEKIIKIAPIIIKGNNYYLIYEASPETTIERDIKIQRNELVSTVVALITFIVIFIFLINIKIKYLRDIGDGINNIADGNLSYKIEIKGKDEISEIAKNINKMAEEINESIANEREIEKTKSELITNVSHDLRTPLTSIMGYVGLIKDGRCNTDAEFKEYIDIVWNKSQKLKGLIEDLFDYTKLNNEGMILKKNEVNIVSFLEQVVDEMSPYFEENNIGVIKSFRARDEIALVDGDKMLRVLENLLTNAIKYSYKPGTVIVGFYEANGYGTISVKNRGDHIEKEKLDKLFDRFYRVDESRSVESGGTGLGLAIAKSIVQKHEGLIWAESEGNEIAFYIKMKLVKK